MVIVALFYYTLILLLCSILTSSTCLSTYLVSRRKLMLYPAVGFLFYFFDCAWAFQADFFSGNYLGGGSAYDAFITVAYLVTGCGTLTSFWLLICDYLGQDDKMFKLLPSTIFVVFALAMLILFPAGSVRDFFYFLPRELYLFWMLLFIAWRYLRSHDAGERARMKRHMLLYVLLWVFGICMVVEDALTFLFADAVMVGPRAYSPDRNISENILMLCCMAGAFRSAAKALALRFDKPPVGEGGPRQDAIADALPLFAKRYQLSDREVEVLRLVLCGSDSQNIASELHLSASTVKVHVHNILQKTGQPNRQALIQDFWTLL